MSRSRNRISAAVCLALGYAAGCDDTSTTPGGLSNSGAAGQENVPAAGTSGSGEGNTAGAQGGSAPGAGAQGGMAGLVNDAGQITEGDASDAGLVAAGGNLPAPLNYQLTGSWPERPGALETQPGTLSYTKITVSTQYLAESCAIGDYNNDGLPDVSSGRRWYEHTPAADASASPSFVEHIFRGGHDGLPREGAPEEDVAGISDDCADFAWDMDGDGWMDIINVAPPDTDTTLGTPQLHATAYWYQNPGTDLSDEPLWAPHLMHQGVRHEQHSVFDVDGDGKPEITGACLDCSPRERLGYFQQEDWTNPTGQWKFHAASAEVVFPFGRGWMHGLGAGDVNGDGKPDIIERKGVWLQQADGSFLPDECPGAGCIQTQLYDGAMVDHRGGAQMYAFDADGDGDQDIVTADAAHGFGLAWYEQTEGMVFTKHYIMQTPAEIDTYGVAFSSIHALEVVDMDGDGVRDIVTGGYYKDLPDHLAYVTPLSEPLLYVFRAVQDGSNSSGSVTFEPILVDDASGVALQLATGHINTDGIPDICVSTKLGLFVFLGE